MRIVAIPRDPPVSVEAQTRRASKTFTGDQQTLHVHSKNSTSFAQKMKKHGYFHFSRSTKWC